MKQQKENPIPVLACSEIGILHSLGLAGIPVYVGSNHEDNMALYSRYAKSKVHFPDYNTKQFINKLCAFGAKQSGKTVLMTDDDQAALAISRHREKLKKYYLFLLPEKETMETLHNKQKFYKKAAKLNLPIPTTFTVSSSTELQVAETKLTFPCILKPVNKEDWRHKDYPQALDSNKKALRCTSSTELYQLYDKISPVNAKVIIQKLIEGADDQHYSINMYIDHEGQIKGYYLYQKIRMCPPKAGRASYLKTVEDDEILKQAQKVAHVLEMRGLVNIQFKRDYPSGTVKLIEVEPRLSVSSFLGTAADMDLAVLYYSDLIGEAPPANQEYRKNVKYFDLLRDIKAFLKYRKEGELSLTDWLRSYRGTTTYNGYSIKDPFPAVMEIWFILSRKLKNVMW